MMPESEIPSGMFSGGKKYGNSAVNRVSTIFIVLLHNLYSIIVYILLYIFNYIICNLYYLIINVTIM